MAAKVGARSLFSTICRRRWPAGTPGPRIGHRHPDVLLVGRGLADEQTVLAHVEAVVRGVDDIGVVEPAGRRRGASPPSPPDRRPRAVPAAAPDCGVVSASICHAASGGKLGHVGRLVAHVRLVERRRLGQGSSDSGRRGAVPVSPGCADRRAPRRETAAGRDRRRRMTSAALRASTSVRWSSGSSP